MYALVSFSHKNTNLALREKLYFDNTQNLAFLAILHNHTLVQEVVLLSTCNRCEVYIFFEDRLKKDNRESHASQDNTYYTACMDIVSLLAEFKQVCVQELQEIVSIELGNHAVHHVFCVASSLMSVVIGETQIGGQMKEAYKLSYNHNFCSKALTRLFHFAFRCAASVRNSTDISKNTVSVASVALSLAFDFLNQKNTSIISNEKKDSLLYQDKPYGDLNSQENILNHSHLKLLDNKKEYISNHNAQASLKAGCNNKIDAQCPFHKGNVENNNDISPKNLNHETLDSKKSAKFLVIGIGEMGVLCLKHLSKRDVSLTLCNRTEAKAKDLLKDLGLEHSVKLLSFTSLKEHLNDFDVVILAVAGGVLITRDMLESRPYKRIFFDLSIPRNLSFTKAQLPLDLFANFEIMCVDDLKVKAQEHINARQENVRMAMGIVGQFTLEFERWLSSLGVHPVIKTMREQAKLASIKEIERAIKKGFIPESMRENVTKLLHSAFNEFLHSPTVKLKEISNEDNADSILEAIANVFGMQDRILLNRYKCEYDDMQ